MTMDTDAGRAGGLEELVIDPLADASAARHDAAGRGPGRTSDPSTAPARDDASPGEERNAAEATTARSDGAAPSASDLIIDAAGTAADVADAPASTAPGQNAEGAPAALDAAAGPAPTPDGADDAAAAITYGRRKDDQPPGVVPERVTAGAYGRRKNDRSTNSNYGRRKTDRQPEPATADKSARLPITKILLGAIALCIVASCVSAVQSWRAASAALDAQSAAQQGLGARIKNIEGLLEEQRDVLDALAQPRSTTDASAGAAQIEALAAAVRANQTLNEQLPELVARQVAARLDRQRVPQPQRQHAMPRKAASPPAQTSGDRRQARRPAPAPTAKAPAAPAVVTKPGDEIRFP